ncbi:ThuA domain-containing protein [Salegentibacter sp. HM20]
MKNLLYLVCFSLALIFMSPAVAQEKEAEEKEEKKVLVFYETKGFWHESIPAAYSIIEDLGEENGFDIKTDGDSSDFNDEDLEEYALVIFLSTTGDVLNDEEQQAFERYIENGGSFFGIHGAADTEYDWPWYGELVGGYFDGHPEVQRAEVIIEMPEHPTVSHAPNPWSRVDEWYNYKNLNPNNKVLMRLDESTYEGGTNGENHPIAWYRELPGGGISIYTGGGHTIQSYMEPNFQEHILRCILFALGEDTDKELIIEQ